MTPWTILTTLAWAKKDFSKHGIETARLDTEVLLAAILGCQRLDLYTQFDRPLTAEELAAFRKNVLRRRQREPVAYITGEKEFYGRSFKVTKDTLIPRPETELIIERVLKISSEALAKVLDIGTGSGCLAITLACEDKDCHVTAVDSCHEALEVARANAQKHGVAQKIEFIHGNIFALKLSCYDVMITNPPYIPSAVIATLVPEIQYEPQLALDGGPDGLTFYRRLAPLLTSLLKPHGHAFLEIGEGQAGAVTNLCSQHHLSVTHVANDLAGMPRVIHAQSHTNQSVV